MTKRKSSVWVAGSILAAEFGFSIDHLDRLRKNGVLKPKTHWKVINPNAIRPTYRYHRNRCESVFDDAG